jgi:DNA-directed RNA polymerase specialized sigma24 family protein
VPIEDETIAVDDDGLAVLALDDAMRQVVAIDPRLEQIIECRCFAGLTVPETARALGMTERTVERDWARARAYLHQAMDPDAP